MRAASLFALLALAGCGSESPAGGSIEVELTGSLAGLRQVRISARMTDGQRMAAPVLVPERARARDVALPTTLLLHTPEGLAGRARLTVEGLDAGGRVLASVGSAPVDFAPGRQSLIRLCFGCPPQDDGASKADGPLMPDAPHDIARADAGLAADGGGVLDGSTPPDDAGAAPIDASAAPIDAGAPPIDAGAPPIDAGAPPIDAAPPEPDGSAPRPPVTTGQAARLVLGQVDFAGGDSNAGGQSAASLDNPFAVWTEGARVFVADAFNQRVLAWDAAPAVAHAPANRLLGQVAMTVSVPAATAQLMRDPTAGTAAGGRVYVSDFLNNRVLVWTSSAQSGTPAELVLGQTSLTATGAGSGLGALRGPYGIWSDGTRVAVVDSGNSRILLWDRRPDRNGQPADRALGRAGTAAAGTLDGPTDVIFDGTRLWVADTGHHRILGWNGWPTTDRPADIVLGQASFAGASPNAGGPVSARGLSWPAGLAVRADALFVSDRDNHRVVVFSPLPTASGDVADLVLGQRDLVSASSAVDMPAADRIYRPRGLAVDGAGTRLYVADSYWDRVVMFELAPPR